MGNEFFTLWETLPLVFSSIYRKSMKIDCGRLSATRQITLYISKCDDVREARVSKNQFVVVESSKILFINPILQYLFSIHTCSMFDIFNMKFIESNGYILSGYILRETATFQLYVSLSFHLQLLTHSILRAPYINIYIYIYNTHQTSRTRRFHELLFAVIVGVGSETTQCQIFS